MLAVDLAKLPFSERTVSVLSRDDAAIHEFQKHRREHIFFGL